MGTITGTILTGITLGQGTYTSPLTVTASGAVDANSGDAIYGSGTQAWAVYNYGTLTGGTSAAAIDLLAGGSTIVNGSSLDTTALIAGGAGGAGNNGYSGGPGGAGGAAIVLAGSGSIGNSGTVAGGAGGAGGTATGQVQLGGDGGAGGVGIALSGGGTIANSGMIRGGAGGDGGYGRGENGYAGVGGVGIALSGGGTIANSGTILGGQGGTGRYYGAGGDGIDLSGGGSIVNLGAILGGTGSHGTGLGISLDQGGIVTNGALISGRVGVAARGTVAGGTIVNYGTITGTAVGIALYSVGSIGNDVGGLIQGYYGVYGKSGVDTVVNAGAIISTGKGVQLKSSGTVVNSGTVEGNVAAVSLYSGAVSNTGTMEASGTKGAGVNLTDGSLGNDVGGLIQSSYLGVAAGIATITNAGTIIGSAAGVSLLFGTLVNSGTISSDGIGVDVLDGGAISNTGTISGIAGIYLLPSGEVTNAGTGLIVGTGTAGVGIYLKAGGTVVDSGTISAAGGAAVFFAGGTGSNLLVLESGYSLSGEVAGSASATNTVELAGSVDGSLTVNYAGVSLTNFTDVLFGSGGHDTLDLALTSGTLGPVLSGFSLASDVIDLTQIGTNGSITSQSATEVTIVGSGGTVTLQLDSSDGSTFTTVSDGTGGTDVATACYRRGTMILTPAGEVAIETLAIADEVMTLSGAARPIRWIGRRAYDGRFIAGNRQVLPIRVTPGALADGVPARDLWVSPGHSLYIDGVLVQSEYLVNGATVTQTEGVQEVEYFHIELDTHDIVFADGAPAESYVDCDNRLMFANGGEYARLHPDDERLHWAFCRSRLEWGDEALMEIRARLLARAAALGHALDTDPGLHLIVDGRVMLPDATRAGSYRFTVPAGAGTVSLASRSTVPAEVVAESGDIRRLGVPIERIVLCDGDLSIDVWHGHTSLREGFYDDEATHRWTDGMARLPDALLRPFPAALILEAHLIPIAIGYRSRPPNRAVAAA